MTEARSAAALFDPARLRTARQLKKLKRVQLAELVGVSGAAISQYESGAAKPRPATLAQIALKLGMPVGFFAATGHQLPSPNADQGFFRSLRSSAQVDRDAALAQAALLSEAVRVIDSRVELPDLNLPSDLSVDPDHDPEIAEAAAEKLRQQWELESGPIPNVVRTLERHGIVVARLKLAEQVDAFSWPLPAPARPVVILGADKGRRDRSRFDAAHELGHLVMHYADPEPASQPLERQANRFAAAFLLPASSFAEDFNGGPVSWKEMLQLKQRWQVSMAALLYRARDLELLSRTAYESAMKQMSRRGWRRVEPGDLGPPERPALLRKATELLAEHGTDLDQLAAQLYLPEEFLADLLGVEEIERPMVEV